MVRFGLVAVSMLMAAPAVAQAKLVSEAQYAPAVGREFVLHSEKLNRDMRIVVRPPSSGGVNFQGQRAADAKLAVVYALDMGHAIAGPVGQFMSNNVAMDPAYQVAVGYAGADMRQQDFGFKAVTVDNYTVGDGGPKFLAFLTDELRPFLHARYPIDPDKEVLFGHSLGGLFAAEVLARKPDAFDAYIVGSPSVYFDPAVIDLLKTSKPKGRVFVSAGENEGRPVDGAKQIAAALAGSPAKVETRIYAGEGHISYYARLAAEGLAYVLPPPIKFEGIALAPAAMDRVVGNYRMPDARVITVKREGPGLAVSMTAMPGQAELKPESETRFFIPGYDSVMIFDLPASGPASGVLLKVNGVEMKAARQ